MTRTTFAFGALVCALALAAAQPAAAQLGGFGKVLDKASKAKQQLDDLTFNDQEEQQLGSEISAKLRDKYGVVQDKDVHKYVTLVGTVLAQESTRPNLKWTFIVLDTDGINAFAAPGGFVHITKGALALIHNESELADVLGHEISHVTLKHTLKAIQKSKGVSALADASGRKDIKKIAEAGYAAVLENAYDRGDEMAADKNGVELANAAGYAPAGLGDFLTRLADRNKDLKDRSGMFASHPETDARLAALKKIIASDKLTATAQVAPRYTQAISFKPAPIDGVSQVASASSSSSGGKLGLSGLSSLGREKSSNQTVSSAGSRGVNPDRDAKGGPIKTLVVVSVTSAEVNAFRKGITN
jgi:predicted Zn-dependent protease